MALEWERGIVAVQEAQSQSIKLPARYSVWLLNDDYTPMDFVIEVLEQFFGKTFEDAVSLMLAIHHQGKAVCGCYSQDVAVTKAREVMDFARKNEHPLLCIVEEMPA